MEKIVALFSFNFLICGGILAQAPSNNNFANAQQLFINGTPKYGTTKGSNLETNESVAASPPVTYSGYSTNQSVWYKFLATTPQTGILISQLGPGIDSNIVPLSSTIWQGISAVPTGYNYLNGQSAKNGPGVHTYALETTVGSEYFIQVFYAKGVQSNGVNNGSGGSFVISVTTSIPSSPTNPFFNSWCGNELGVMHEFIQSTTPTNAQISANCTADPSSFQVNIAQSHVFKIINNQCGTLTFGSKTVSSGCGSSTVAFQSVKVWDENCVFLGAAPHSNMVIGNLPCGVNLYVQFLIESENCTISQFIPWAYGLNTGCFTPLNIDILSFNAVKKENHALLSVTLKNDERLSLIFQRSKDAAIWADIDNIQIQNHHQAAEYKSIDMHPAEGINYYRVKLINQNDLFQFTNIASLKFGISSISLLQGNDEFIILTPEKFNVIIVNTCGQTVLTASDMQHISLSNLANGIYGYSITTPTEVLTGKIIR